MKSALRHVWLAHWISSLGFSVALAWSNPLHAQEFEAKKTCAKTPTYEYFEDVQYRAYNKNPVFYQLLQGMRDIETLLKNIKTVEGDLAKRPNSLNSKPSDVGEYVATALRSLVIPTCYENPAIYWLINEYAKQIETARVALNLAIPSGINLATLPTAEVNAHTYPAFGGLGNVIAFNIQLFMFDHQMVKTVLPTIDITPSAGGMVSIDHSAETAQRKIRDNPDILTEFSMALLEFIGLVPPSTRPINQAYDPLLSGFTTGMELFAVAHEFAHLVEQHVSPTASRSLSVNDGQAGSSQSPTLTIPVLARSWQQELDADQIGMRLVMTALRARSDAEPERDLNWLYSAKGALFFFRCLEIVEQARAIKDSGEDRPAPTFAERVFLRAFVNGKSTADDNERYQHLTKSSHPPAWLRMERAQATIEAELAVRPPSRQAAVFAEIAEGLLENTPLVWRAVVPRFPMVIEAARLASASNAPNSAAVAELKARADAMPLSAVAVEFQPGCYPKPGTWQSTFLCSPPLQAALVAFQAGVADDGAVIELYREAVRRDWLLLSGAQLQWAVRTLLKGKSVSGIHRDGLAILAFGGNRSHIKVIEALDLTGWSQEDRALVERTRAFIVRHGRDLSIDRLATIQPEALRLVDFLSFPGDAAEVAVGIPEKASIETQSFVSKQSGVSRGEPISGLALALVYRRFSPGKIDDSISEVLKSFGFDEAALRYAYHGVASGGPLTSLENTIGNILTKRNDFEQANVHYTASLAAGRNDGWPELNMASNLERLGNLDEAERMYRKALARRATARSPFEFAQYLNAAAWFLTTKRSDDRQKLQEALALSFESNSATQRRDADFLDTLAECQFNLGDIPGAIATAQAALELIHSNDHARRQQFGERVAYFKNAKR